MATVPTATSFRKSRYPATPTLSVDAFQASDTDVWVAPENAMPCGTDGAWVSVGGGQADVAVVSDRWALRLPAASYASTARA